MVHMAGGVAIAVALHLFQASSPSGAPLTERHPTTAQIGSAPRELVVGTVADGSGGRIRGATIVIRAESPTALELLTQSDAEGRFEVTGLAAGRYQLSVTAPGFAPTFRDLDVPAEREIDVRLTPAPVVEAVQVVSASRQIELRQSLNTKVDVVSRKMMDDTGAETVGDVLRDVPGVLVRRGSETAGTAGEQIQGIDSRQVLVLLDGQPIVGARGIKRGVINLDRQSTGRLDRVEVVKGAASALYGSDAMGGVINLITREASSPLEMAASISGGSSGAMDARAEAGVRRSAVSGLFTLERHERDGFDLTPSTFDTTGAAFRRVDALAKSRVQLMPSLSLTGLVNGYANNSTGRSNGELGPQEDDIDDSTVNAGVTADWLLAPSTTIQARGYLASYEEDSTGRLAPPLSTGLAPGALDERFARLDASISRTVGSRQHVQGGVEWSHNEYSGINRLRNDDGEEATTSVAWAQHRIGFGRRVTTTAGVRVDHHSAFGTAVSPKVGANARLTDELYVRASYGRGFRAPDLGQLYYRFLNPTNFYQVIGNPGLEPEHSDSLQLGAEYLSSGHRLRFGANIFYNDIRDLIESHSLGFVSTAAQLEAILAAEGLDTSFRPVLGRQLLTYKNVNDAVTRGLELDGEVALTNQLSAGGAYTYLDAFDSKTDLSLTGRHRHHGTVRLGWRLERFGFRTNLRGTFYSSWIAARASNGTETIAPRFALWDLFAAQRLIRGLSVFAEVDNLTDNQDPHTGVLLPSGSPAAIYRPEIGRTAKAGLRWSWK